MTGAWLLPLSGLAPGDERATLMHLRAARPANRVSPPLPNRVRDAGAEKAGPQHRARLSDPWRQVAAYHARRAGDGPGPQVW